MANDFFNATGYPTTRASGASSSMRAQLAAIAAAFDKMPVLTGNGGRMVGINAGGTALEALAAINGIPIGGTTPAAGAFTTLAASGSVSLGDAAADTLSVGGSTVKNGSGNWSLPAPSSGATLALSSFAGAAGLSVSSAAASDAQISLAAISYARDWRLKVMNADGSFRLRDETGGNDRLLVDISGNVGIGTTPLNTLHLSGAVGAATMRFADDFPRTLGFIGSGSGIIATSAAADLGIRAETNLVLASGGNVERMRIGTSGQMTQNRTAVGISGNANTALSLAMGTGAYLSAKGSGGQEMIAGADSGGVTVGSFSNHQLTLRTNNVDRMTADITGQFGIGLAPVSSGDNRGLLQLNGSANGGVYFGNTANTAKNVLDWYEENTFTPTPRGDTVAGTYTNTSRHGTYTRVGNRVKGSFFLNGTINTWTGIVQVNCPVNINTAHDQSEVIGQGIVRLSVSGPTSWATYYLRRSSTAGFFELMPASGSSPSGPTPLSPGAGATETVGISMNFEYEAA